MLKKITQIFLLVSLSLSVALAQDNPVHFKLSSKKVSACEYDLIFSATIDEPWHMY